LSEKEKDLWLNNTQVKKQTPENKESENLLSEEVKNHISDIVVWDSKYDWQKRSLEWYYKWMNASMALKVWPTMVHLLWKEGNVIVDMWTGSGNAASTYANLFEGSKIIWVDINPESVSYCNKTFSRQDNLSFQEWDVEKQIFPEESIDAILNSSTLHHVSSFNWYSKKSVENSIINQIKELKTWWLFVIRDFLAPEENKDIIIELDTTQNPSSQENKYEQYSDSELFEIFAQTARSMHEEPGFPIMKLKSQKKWFNRYKVSHKNAVEFVLRKDYRKTWEVENKEEYTYFNQNDFENIFEENGMRIIASYPYKNPWIQKNRFEDKFNFYDLDWERLDYPATNHIIIWQKVSINSTHGNKITQKTKKEITSNKETFLKRKSYISKIDWSHWDIVKRPGEVNDIIPYMVDEKTWELKVAVKWWYPRPIIITENQSLDKKNYSWYICEAHSLTSNAKNKDISRRLWIHKSDIEWKSDWLSYFTSPWIIDEKVNSKFLKCNHLPRDFKLPDNISVFKNSGDSRLMSINDILKAYQTWTMPESRLEINLYFLLKEYWIEPEEWIWDEIDIEESEVNKDKIIWIEKIIHWEEGELFIKSDSKWDYIRHYKSSFEENLEVWDFKWVLSETEIEYIEPKNHSNNVLSALPVIKDTTTWKIYIWIEKQNYPTVQEKDWNSTLWWVPSYRLDKNVTTYSQLDTFNEDKIWNSKIQKIWESYKSSLWVTNETIYPYITWVPKYQENIQYIEREEIMKNIKHIKDAHLLVTLFRLDHILLSQK